MESIVNLPQDHTASSVNAAIGGLFAKLPPAMKRTLTWDQGVEIGWHQELTQVTRVPMYFAERSSPWQRGTDENFNGLLRQYVPKGTNLAVHSTKHVSSARHHFNHEITSKYRANHLKNHSIVASTDGIRRSPVGASKQRSLGCVCSDGNGNPDELCGHTAGLPFLLLQALSDGEGV